jgi:hypothetical protein
LPPVSSYTGHFSQNENVYLDICKYNRVSLIFLILAELQNASHPRVSTLRDPLYMANLIISSICPTLCWPSRFLNCVAKVFDTHFFKSLVETAHDQQTENNCEAYHTIPVLKRNSHSISSILFRN